MGGDQEKKALWKKWHRGSAFSGWSDSRLRSCREGAMNGKRLGL